MSAHDKIRKLLAMTVENGCSEDEAETAMRMAASIAARGGIELDSLRAKDEPKRKAKSKYHSAELKPHQALAAHAAAVLYGVECNAGNLGKYGVMFVGREELIELTEETMFWLFRQIEELYKSSLPKGLSKSERGEYRKTFKAACAQRVLERARAVMRDIKAGGAQAATGQNALVVVGYFDQLKAEQDQYWEDVYAADRKRLEARLAAMTPAQREAYEEAQKNRKAPRMTRGRSIPTGSGTRAGRQAGDQVKLRKEVK